MEGTEQLQVIAKNKLPIGTPPVPRGYVIAANTDGLVFCFPKPADKMTVPIKFYSLRVGADPIDLAWEDDNQFPTLPIREMVIEQGLRLEIKFPGTRMTAKAPKCSTILRTEYGMKGAPLSLYVQFCKFRKIQLKADLAELALAEGVS